jgi:hypothetical protein
MTLAAIFLLLLFVLTLAHLVTLKLCSNRLDHRTAPLFVSAWTLIGLAIAAPKFGYLLGEGWQIVATKPLYIGLIIIKGLLLYRLFVVSQQLMAVSLSSRHYVTPLAVGLLSIGNWFLGEQLAVSTWVSALSLCALAAGFFCRGHLSEMDKTTKLAYGELVLLSVAGGMLDHSVTSAVNWYTLLLLSNLVLLPFALMMTGRNLALIKSAAFHPMALLAGSVYAATELVKFYQQVEINPVTTVVIVQSMTKPVILVLSALIWHERTVREQMVWGAVAFAAILPMILF